MNKINWFGIALGLTMTPSAAHGARTLMKAKIVITPKKAVLDPQGKTVQTALEHMGYELSLIHI